MNRLHRWLSAIIVAALVVAGLPFLSQKYAGAAVKNPSYCSQVMDKLDNGKFGKDIPVILVHGIEGGSADWGARESSGSFYSIIDSLPFVSVAQAFSYDAQIIDLANAETIYPAAEKLAATIHCASMISDRNGGQGKVIVVGYSLGGLVARLALSYSAIDKSGKKHKVSNMVSQVFTIGTPHKGLKDPATKNFASAIPRFPGSVDVFAIAGDLTRVQTNDSGLPVKVKKANGDGLVSVNSATTGHSRSGTARRIAYIYECRQEYAKGQTAPNVGCEHSQLIKTPSSNLSRAVADDIYTYHGQNNRYSDRNQFTAGNLRIVVNDQWLDATSLDMGMTAFDSTNGVRCTNCDDTQPQPIVYAFVDVAYYGLCQKTILECVLGENQALDEAPNIRVGGKKPDFSAKYLEIGMSPAAYGYVWCFDVQKVCISYRRGAPGVNLGLSEAFRELMAAATWAK